MKSFQRMGGKMMKRSEDQQDVGAVIAEFRSVENMLERLTRDLKTWRDSWDDVLKLQYDASEAFANLYKPLEPAPEPDDRHIPQDTPQAFMQKCLALQKMYSDEKADLQQEVAMITTKVIRPVEEAKAALRGLGKTLKHRENMKLDYERYLSRAEHARKKGVKSVKEEQALSKSEGDLTQAKIDYQTADEQVISTFPPVSQAVASLMPFILASQVILQTTLVGQLYTSLDAYCREQKMPSPAPSDSEIVGRWESEFTSLRKEIEQGLVVISTGKTVHQSMNIPDKDTSSLTGLGIRNKARSGADVGRGYLQKTKSGTSIPQQSSNDGRTDSAGPDEEEAPPMKPPRPGGGSGTSSPFRPGMKPRISSTNNVNTYAAAYDQKLPSNNHNTSYERPPPPYQESVASPVASSHYATPLSTPTAQYTGDYFGGAAKPSASSLASNAAAAAKKKPPPPVPMKRIASAPQAQYVTALYDFSGQNEGDLSFTEGDRILVVRKTGSTDDWWEGQLGGRKGSFPANYVQL